MGTPSSQIRALSVRQPWAELILAGHKTVENRTWSTRWRGPIVLHAGRQADRAAAALAAHYSIHTPPTGAYLGVVELVEVHHDRDCHRCGGCDDWGQPDTWHWVLRNPRRLAAPVPGLGQLNLYRPPATLVAGLTSAAPVVGRTWDAYPGQVAR